MAMAKKANIEMKVGPRGAAKKEAFHREAESRMRPFSFEPPKDSPERSKVICHLAGSDILQGSIQIIPEGGDNNLHYHPGADGFWMVLTGKVRFYGPDGVIGEYGTNEGILVPRNARYWFETADPKRTLHLLHVTAHTERKVKNRRINVAPPNEGYLNAVRLNFVESGGTN